MQQPWNQTWWWNSILRKKTATNNVFEKPALSLRAFYVRHFTPYTLFMVRKIINVDSVDKTGLTGPASLIR
jgi:CRISPR/Cas system type I-B associated protein Csh2 (Cas7 group RAMP superfamily)